MAFTADYYSYNAAAMASAVAAAPVVNQFSMSFNIVELVQSALEFWHSRHVDHIVRSETCTNS